MKEFRRLAFKGMANELKNPSDQKEREPVKPQAMNENAGEKKRQRHQDCRDAQGMAQPVHRMLMAGRVLSNPLLARAMSKHERQ